MIGFLPGAFDVTGKTSVTVDIKPISPCPKPAGLHVVITGRNAKPALVELADLVTEMTMVKHPFQAGVKAQPGIEF